MAGLDFMQDLPTPDEIAKETYGVRIPKGHHRLDRKGVKDRQDRQAERDWKKAIWARDEGRCRCCGRRVQKTIVLMPLRGECHHVAGRSDRGVRWDVRNGILTCLADHGKVTRYELRIVCHEHFTVDGRKYINADSLKLTFEVADRGKEVRR